MVALDRGANVEQIVWELDRVPDADRFCAAWQAAIDGFDALRLAFIWPEGAEPQQAVLGSVQMPFRRLDDPVRDPVEQQARLERFLEDDRRAGFDLRSPPMMRVTLLVLGESRGVCVWTIHHTLIDGNCYATVLERVLDGYAGARRAGRLAVPADDPQFTDFLEWMERSDPVPGIRHFTELLAGIDAPTPLPLQQREPRTAANRSSQVSTRLGAPDAESIRALARETGATPNTLVQLAWALLLSRYSGEDDVVFGATWSGRVATVEHAARIVGPLINTLPVRVRLREAGTVRDAIAGLRRQHVAMRAFQQTPAAKIKAATALARSPHLFPSVVVFESRRFYSVLRDQDDRWRDQKLWSRSQANLPLVLAAYFEDDALVVELEYDVGLYTDSAARRLLSDYARILSGLGESLDRSPLRVHMLEPSLRDRLTAAEAAREVAPRGPCAIEQIFERASLAAAGTAVKEVGADGIGYGELERRVRLVAAALRSRGVGQGSLVCILLPRSTDAIVALLAVHASGGAFVPLDPTHPLQRLEFKVRDSGAKVVLVNRETRGRLRCARELELDVDRVAGVRAPHAPGAPSFPDPASPAYVIYTSGSTGEPKGVCVSHGALANHVAAAIERFALGPRDRVLQFAALTFDVCLEEVMPTLAAGATLVLRNGPMTTSAAQFFKTVERERVTVLNLPTSFWHQLVRAEHLSWPACVRLVVVGGEQVSPEAHRMFRAAGTGHIRWLNAYGPTETTITSTWYDDAEGEVAHGYVPIGRPLPGVSHFVFDRWMRVTPPGEPGELYIGGAGVADGYIGRDDLTRRRFVEHPFRAGARLYATGDRVWTTESGNYVFQGRLDEQVKVRGFRVELGEIEARLRQHPAVSDAAVVVQQGGGGDATLVGFIAAEPAAVTAAGLRAHLSATLPSYMIPARLEVRPELPKASSGKIDRALLATVPAAAPENADAAEATSDPLTAAVMDVWSGLLDARVTGPSASFFDLGGDSLLVVQMFTEIELRLGRICDAPAFFRNPTVANLAELLRTAKPSERPIPLVELKRGHAGVRPLFLAPVLTGRGFEYVHLAEALSDEVPVYGLRTPPPPAAAAGPETLADLASHFASTIREVQPRGPYAVGGFSAAGVVAMAIAEELRALGEHTDLVAVIDSVPPRSVPVPSPFGSPRRLARFARTALGRVREALDRPDALTRLRQRTRSAVLRSITRWRLLPIHHDPTAGEAIEDSEAELTEPVRDRMRQYFDAIWTHEFRKMPIEMVLFRVPLDPFEGPHEPELGWHRVTSGSIAVEYLAGTHDSVLKRDGARQLAARLETYLNRRQPTA